MKKNTIFLILAWLFCTSTQAQLVIRNDTTTANKTEHVETKPSPEPQHFISVMISDIFIGGIPVFYQYTFTDIFAVELGVGPNWYNSYLGWVLDPASFEEYEPGPAGITLSAGTKFFVNRGGLTKEIVPYLGLGYTYRQWNMIGNNISYTVDKSLEWHDLYLKIGVQWRMNSILTMDLYTGYAPHWRTHSQNDGEGTEYTELGNRGLLGFRFGIHF